MRTSRRGEVCPGPVGSVRPPCGDGGGLHPAIFVELDAWVNVSNGDAVGTLTAAIPEAVKKRRHRIPVDLLIGAEGAVRPTGGDVVGGQPHDRGVVKSLRDVAERQKSLPQTSISESPADQVPGLTDPTVNRTELITFSGKDTLSDEPSLGSVPTETVDLSEKLSVPEATWSSRSGRSCSTMRLIRTGFGHVSSIQAPVP